MNDLQKILRKGEKAMKNLVITEYQNQRILTTAQLAESYETTGDLISKNFNRNTMNVFEMPKK